MPRESNPVSCIDISDRRAVVTSPHPERPTNPEWSTPAAAARKVLYQFSARGHDVKRCSPVSPRIVETLSCLLSIPASAVNSPGLEYRRSAGVHLRAWEFALAGTSVVFNFRGKQGCAASRPSGACSSTPCGRLGTVFTLSGTGVEGRHLVTAVSRRRMAAMSTATNGSSACLKYRHHQKHLPPYQHNVAGRISAPGPTSL